MSTIIQSETQDLTWFGLSLHPQNRSPSLGCSHWTQICLRGSAPHWSIRPPLDLTDLHDLTDHIKYIASHWGLFTMVTQLPHHLDLTDQDTTIASHKRSFHKNIMLKLKHIKNLFISHTRGGIPHQTYYRLRKETKNLTPHINLWRFFKKPLQDLKIL